MTDAHRPDPSPGMDPGEGSPVTRESASLILDRAAELIRSGDYADAAAEYRRATFSDDPAVRGPALLGLGEALYRLDDDANAVATWESVLELPENPATYPAWRNVAAARVREGDLDGAIAAYREADRRAPAGDKAEIANRLGWLAKETGNTRAAGRYFAKGRGAGPAFPISWLVIGITVFVSFAAESAGGQSIFEFLQLDKYAVAAGEYYRLWSVTLVHGGLLHLALNMYALFFAGLLVEQLYGWKLFILFYLLCAAAGSIASFAFGSDLPSVGASGAIFGLFGIIFAASRAHHPVLDRQRRSIVGQVGMVILLNIVIGFSFPQIDQMAHLGGLVAGLWLGLLFVPGKVPTLSRIWQRPAGAERATSIAVPVAGTAALVVALVAGVVYGTNARDPGTAGVESAVFRPVDAGWFDAAGGELDPEALIGLAESGPVTDAARAQEVAMTFARFVFGNASVRPIQVEMGELETHCDAECEELESVAAGPLWGVTVAVHGSGADGLYRLAVHPALGTPVGLLRADTAD